MAMAIIIMSLVGEREVGGIEEPALVSTSLGLRAKKPQVG